jgi:hypothetical protein
MTTQTPSPLARKLRALYGASRHAAALLDHVARRDDGKDQSITMEAAVAALQTVDPSAGPADARTVLRDLELAGCGKFVVGRRGFPSRLEWSVNAAAAGLAARGETDELAWSPGAEIRPTVAMHDVQFPLRDDLILTLSLPKDLTEREAERLATFLRSLPQ